MNNEVIRVSTGLSMIIFPVMLLAGSLMCTGYIPLGIKIFKERL